MESHEIVSLGGRLVLQGLNKPWQEILHLGVKRIFAANTQITLQDLKDHFFYLEKGRIRMSYTSNTGQEYLATYLGKDILVGDMSMPDRPRRSVFYFDIDTIMWQLPRKLLHDHQFLCDHPHLFHNLWYSASVKLAQSFEHASGFAVHSPMQRLCSILVYLHEVKSDPGLTHEDMAAFLGMHRSTLTRLLHSLREAGVLGQFSKKRLEILDLVTLKRLESADLEI